MGTLVTCPTCGKAMSSNALSCPHCGETEFYASTYHKVVCGCCNGTGEAKVYNTIKEVFYNRWKKTYESSADSSIVLNTGKSKRDFENRIIEDALGKNQFVSFTKTRAHENPYYPGEYGDFEYYYIDSCFACDGKGFKEEYVGKRDCRKPHK